MFLRKNEYVNILPYFYYRCLGEPSLFRALNKYIRQFTPYIRRFHLYIRLIASYIRRFTVDIRRVHLSRIKTIYFYLYLNE